MTESTQLEKFIAFLQTLPRDTEISVVNVNSCLYEVYGEFTKLEVPKDGNTWSDNVWFSTLSDGTGYLELGDKG